MFVLTDELRKCIKLPGPVTWDFRRLITISTYFFKKGGDVKVREVLWTADLVPGINKSISKSK